MILNTFGPAFGLPDASPFCTKAMYLLNMSGVEWQANPGFDSRKAPMQKLPVLVDNDQIIADSDAIRSYLEQTCGTNFDRTLDQTQESTARALIRMAEEHLYFCLLYDRWQVDANWVHIKRHFFSELPAPLRAVIPGLVRRSVLGSLKGQGMGRFTYAEMLVRAEKDLSAFEQFIGDGPFLFGKAAVAADASVGSVLAAIAASPAETELRARVRRSDVLMEYITAVSKGFFPVQAECR